MFNNKTRGVVVCFSLLLAWIAPAYSQSWSESFFDPEDGQFDVSRWLLRSGGFLPVPAIVTEPAIGFGLGGALLFFHESKASPDPNRQAPPSISGGFGLVTENDSWAAGGLHFGSWKNDSIRYLGAALVPSVNLKFYGGDDNPRLEDGLGYNLKGEVLLQELTFRVSDSPVFVGGRLVYMNAKSRFDVSNILPGIGTWELDHDSLGLGFITRVDTRDTIFTPDQGIYASAVSTLMNTNASVGGRNEYQVTDLQGTGYWPMGESMVCGVNLKGSFGSGSIPYYALPSISLRGIPAMRYQGRHALSAEAELRWDIQPRWSLVGFTGLGQTANSLDDFGRGSVRWSGGVGFSLPDRSSAQDACRNGSGLWPRRHRCVLSSG